MTEGDRESTLLRPVSRRDVLKGLAKGAGTAVLITAGGGLVKLLGGSTSAQKSTPSPAETPPPTEMVAASPQSPEKSGASVLFERVFHDLGQPEKEAARRQVEAMKAGLSARSEYRQLLAVTGQWQELIRPETSSRGILPQTGLGIILVENSGGTDKTSTRGARGIAQLIPDTARDYGMRVAYDWQTGGIDERTDPARSIKVMAMYLRDNKKILAGDEGLAIWSYHAGIGRTIEFVRVYLRNNFGVDIGDWEQAFVARDNAKMHQIQTALAQLVQEKKVNVHQILTNRAVDQMIRFKLGNAQERDETELYVYKVVAAAELFEEDQDKTKGT